MEIYLSLTERDLKSNFEKYRPSTAGIRNSGFSAKSKLSAFNKSKYQTESEVLLNQLLLIHQTIMY